KSKKNVQDAHDAIRPTSVMRTPEDMKPYLTSEQYKVYKLIWERFVASQMSSAVLDITTVIILAGDYEFRVSGSQIKFEGYLAINRELLEEKKKKKKEEDDEANLEGDGEDIDSKLLPNFTEGEELDLVEFKPEQKFTKPPARYSEATLVKALEENGIGRPSTYAPIIKTIQDRNYVKKEEKRFSPTPLGDKVTELLIKYFGNIMDKKFTAEMEDHLDDIELGDREWHEVLHEFYDPFKKTLDKVEENIKDIKKEIIEVDEECPDCGAKLVLKVGKYGEFYACSKYPDCKYTRNMGEEDSDISDAEIDEKCEKCGAAMVMKRGRFGKFLACSKYPECKTTKSISTGIKCPEEGCKGQLVKRKAKKSGRTFYGCSNYPECKYITNKLDDLKKEKDSADE
ncbi:topoisomerase DNA-binding C4 zinc finger domain-containing protein, partial [bacterium]|nr:topoisomerase DNA-binding C4 zinc finger domain-containing protein [bacterium]